MVIRAGRLRQLVTIQQPTFTQDAAGQQTASWGDVEADVPAEVEAVAGGETRRGLQVEATVTTVITMRWRADVGPTWRIVHDGRTLNIERAVDPDGRRIELVGQCKEVI